MSKTLVGQALSRVDGRLKVTGQARYTADMPLQNLAHAVVVSSAISHGRISKMETQRAETAPGVLTVLTPFNCPKFGPSATMMNTKGPRGTAGQGYLPLQDSSILSAGQHIAVVVAETREQASAAASLIEVTYERERPLVNIDEANLITPKIVWGSPPDTLHGDIEQGLAEATIQIDQHYVTAMQHHNAMETHASVAVWEGESLTLYDSSSWVYGARKAVANWLEIPEENVRVIAHFVGGSFGYKGFTWPHSALTAIAARIVQRPVKLVLTRAQEFTSVGYRPEVNHHIRLAATRDGRLTAIVHDAVAKTAWLSEDVVAPVTKTTRKLYACPNIATTYRLAPLNVAWPSTMRGPGESLGLFAVESAMDELAYAANLDPLELRLRNYADLDPETGNPWSSKALHDCYQQGAERFGWEKRTPQPGSMSHDDVLVGWGMSTTAYDVRLTPTSASACMSSDGKVLVQSATCDQGTGSYTVMRQIAADALGLPITSVTFELGDTDMPMAPVSAGSFSAASVGSAVQKAALSLRHQVLQLARADERSPLYGLSEEQIVVAEAACFPKDRPTQGETYAEILTRQHLPQVDVLEHVLSPGEAEQRKPQTHYMFGAHFVEVQIHRLLGTVRVTRYVARFGAGRILNPKTAHSQLIGGIIWGIGMALMEQTVLNPQTGQIVNADLADAYVPVNADIPAIDADFVFEDDPDVNPLGIKGIGEISTIGSAAAIANAVYHATGKRIRTLPITWEKVSS